MEGDSEFLSDGLGPWPLSAPYGNESALYSYENHLSDVDYSGFFPKYPYNKPRVLPYIRRRDLNNVNDAPLEDNPPKYAWEIGIKGEF